MKKKRIMIAEDVTLLREGLRMMINAEENLEVVAEAEDGISAVKTALGLMPPPDLVMIDLSMPKMNGLSAIKEIKRQSPDTKILTLTIHDSDEYILECFKAGVAGYCLKDSSQDELLKAISLVLSGKIYISPGIAGKVMQGYLEGKKTLKEETKWDTLTQREKEVLKLVGEGHTSKQIAELFCISPKTVERHRANIMSKLDLHKISELTAYAIDMGLIVR